MTVQVTADLLILGSGPAGCAAAIVSNAHGFDVVMVDRATADKPTVGEHLSPEGVVTLKSLGLGALIDSPEHAPCPFIESAWGEAQLATRDYITSAHGPGVNLDRLRFDAELRAQAIARGTRLFSGSHPTQVSRDDTGWTAILAGDTAGVVVRARFLVDATGRTAWLGRRLGAQVLQFDRLVAVFSFLKALTGARAGYGSLLIEATATGWWYSVNLPSGFTVAAWMTEADMVREGGRLPDRSWRDHLVLAPFTSARCTGLIPTGPTRVACANSQCLEPTIGDAWLATGDAAQAHDPLSSAGIFKGLHHGALAGDAAVAYLRGDIEALPRYARRLTHDFTDYLETRHAYYAMEQRWPDTPFWRLRHSPAT